MKKGLLITPNSFAVRLGLSHWAYAAALQLRPILDADITYSAAQSIQIFLLLQIQNVAVASSLMLLTWLLSSALAGRCLIAIVGLLFHLALSADQVYYRIFQQHFHLSALEGLQTLQGALWSSFFSELDAWFIIQSLSAIALTLWWLRLAMLVRVNVLQHASALPIVALFLGTGAVSLVAYHFDVPNKDGGLHPLFAVFDGIGHTPLQSPADNDYVSPIPFSENTPPLDGTFIQLQENLHQLLSPRNIILVILESVGAKQLLIEQGRPSPTLTPNIHALSQHSVLFDALYSVFPGTVRSHVAINTGGLTLTWGNVFHEFSFPYMGHTLASTLRAQGYETALFASQRLDFENMEGFYTRAGYDTVFDFGREPGNIQQTQAISSWGAREEYTLEKLEYWLTKQRDRSKPFLVTYLTVATHHPYDFPVDLPGAEPSKDRQARYRNALRYTDRAIGTLAALLQSEDLASDTILAITGDHGQAFGDIHVGNLVHKHFLYEENIRSFLLLHNSKAFPQPVKSDRVGSIGDIMPTLLDAAGVPGAPVPGTSLLEAARAERPVFFYKNAHPAQWGLRHRNWKYIAAMTGEAPELYDLNVDPTEQYNVANQFPEQISLYQRLVEQWYFRTNDVFVANLKDYAPPGGRTLRPSDIAMPGPKLLAVGRGRSTGGYSGVDFQAASTLHPEETPIAWTQWSPYSEPHEIIFQWHSPSGSVHRHKVTVEPGWLLSYIGYEGPIPLEEGTWRLELIDARSGKTLLDTSFAVDTRSPLYIRVDSRLEALEAAAGLRRKSADGAQVAFEPADILASDDSPVIWTSWVPAPRTRWIWVSWESPRGIEAEGYFHVQQAWNQTWINFDGQRPLTPGVWNVTLWDESQEVLLVEEEFEIKERTPSCHEQIAAVQAPINGKSLLAICSNKPS